MKLVEQSVDVWGECPTDIYEAKRWIERAGRVCYNSEMGEDPDVFLDKVMSHDPPHSAMFEHSNLVTYSKFPDEDLCNSKWINLNAHNQASGNIRAYMEVTKTRSIDSLVNYLYSIDTYPIKPEFRYQRRVTVQLITDRNVLAEITRHRDDVGFCVQSQRYVDLSKEIEFIKPSWFNKVDFIPRETFIHSCEQSELNYRTLRRTLPPQHARVSLTGQCKTVIVMTAYLPEWDWIFKLRRAPEAYPQMRLLMDMVYSQFKDLGYV